MNELIRPEDVPQGVPVTAVLQLRNAHLHEAAKRLGSQRKLADALGVTQNTICDWIGLKACPPSEPTQSWPQKRIDLLERRLVKVVGKTLDEVFPPELRDNVEFLQSPKRFERTIHVRGAALEDHARRTRERLEAHGDPLRVDRREEDMRLLREIAGKTALSKRERYVIARRYPADGQWATIEEIAKELRVTRERVRQIEEKAVRRLRQTAYKLKLHKIAEG